MRLGITRSQCIDWVPGMLNLVHAHIRCYRMGGNTLMVFGSSCNKIHHIEDNIFQLSPNLVTQLWYSETWMNRMPIYWLCPRLVRPCPCIHTICGMSDNISLTCGSSPNNIHHPEDDFVLLYFLQNWFPQLGCSKALTNMIPGCIDCVTCLLDHSHA